MLQGRKGLGRIVPSIALGCLLAVPVWAAPGDPLGGDDTGCAPTTKQGLSCGLKIHALLAKLKRAALVCHLTQDGHAFQTGMGTPGFANAEDNCETGPSSQSAKAKFDAKMAKLSILCDPTVVANANARRDTILGNAATPGSLDSLNANAFCDATTGIEIDAGENIGFIPRRPKTTSAASPWRSSGRSSTTASPSVTSGLPSTSTSASRSTRRRARTPASRAPSRNTTTR